MALNLRNVGNIKNNVIRRLKNDYVSLRFIGMAPDSESFAYLSPAIATGWSYYPDFTLDDGQVTELLKISDNPTVTGYLDGATALRLFYANGNFMHFNFNVVGKPKPNLYEWFVSIQPNAAETYPIA